jgi:hypothetical protein
MEDECQASPDHNAAGMDDSNVEVDTLERSTVIGIGEPEHLDTEGSDMNADVTPPIPSQLADVIESVRVLLTLSVSTIKSENQSNGYLVGAGRKKSMIREPWEHLQYAADLLAGPEAGVYDLLLAIQCLAHSDVTYEAQPIPWDEIHAKYPAPVARAIVPICMPGPPEGWVDIDPEWEQIWRSHLADTTAPRSVPTPPPL